MGRISDAIAWVWRDFITDGVSSSGLNEPSKAEIRAIGPVIEEVLGAGLLGGVEVYKETRALLEADLAYAEGTKALVWGDATNANNDIYIKTGASGAGGWTLTTIVHDVLEAAGKPWADSAQASAVASASSAGNLRAVSRPTVAPNVITNAIRRRFQAETVAGFTAIAGGNVTGVSVSRAFSQTLFDRVTDHPGIVYRVSGTASEAGSGPRFSIPISPADLISNGITPSDASPPTMDVIGAIQLANAVNQTLNASTNTANGQMWVLLRYAGAGASLAGPNVNGTDVQFRVGANPDATGLGSGDSTFSGSTYSKTADANEVIMIRRAVKIPATYGGQALTGVILYFFGQATAAGVSSFDTARVAVVPGGQATSGALNFYNRPEDTMPGVGRRNLESDVLALIDGAATKAEVNAKATYYPPLQPATVQNAVRRRYSATANLPGPHGAIAGGTSGTAVATSVYNAGMWSRRGEPSAMKLAGTATGAAQTGPRGAYYITLADLVALGVTPSDVSPPAMSFCGAIDLATLVNQTINVAAITNGQCWLCLRYAGAGAALEGTAHSGATDVIINTSRSAGASASGLGNLDPVWNNAIPAASLTASEKLFTFQNVPIRATYGGQALTGILLVFFGNATASGESSFVTGGVAAISGATINPLLPYMNGAEDQITAQTTSSSVAPDNAWTYDAVTGTSLLASTSLAPPTTGIDYLVLTYGQSWATGANGDGLPIITTTAQHAGKALMPSVGVRPNGAGFGSYVNLIEAGGIETISSGMADIIMTKLNTRLGIKPRMIFAVAAMGGQGIAAGDTTSGSDIGVGSDTFEEALRIVRSCASISAAAGRRLVVLGMVWLQGEQDFTDGTSRLLYQRGMVRIRQVFEAKARELTGQLEPIPLYTYQTNRGGASVGVPCQPALAQLEATKQDPLIRCWGPVYWVDTTVTDPSHTTPTSYRELGVQAGNMLVEDWFGPYWEPLHVVEYWWSASNKFCLRFHVPNVPNDPDTRDGIAIEADDSKITISTLGAGKGIDFDDGSGSAPAITGIAVLGGTTDTIEVTLASSPTGGRKRAWIASKRTATANGKVSGARSGIRASTSYATDSLTGRALYHWAAAQEIVLS